MDIPLDEQNIINILGIEALPDERKIAIIERVSELVQKRLFVRLLDFLNASDKEELTRFLDSGDQKGLGDFLQEKVPNFADWIEEEVRKIKKELADFAESSFAADEE